MHEAVLLNVLLIYFVFVMLLCITKCLNVIIKYIFCFYPYTDITSLILESLVLFALVFLIPLTEVGTVYDQPNNDSFISQLEQVQYNAALAITGAIKCTSRSKLYNELGLESLESRRRLRRLCFLHKIISNGLPAYLHKLT